MKGEEKDNEKKKTGGSICQAQKDKIFKIMMLTLIYLHLKCLHYCGSHKCEPLKFLSFIPGV